MSTPPNNPYPHGAMPEPLGYSNAPYAGGGGMGWGVNPSKNYFGGWALALGIAGIVVGCGPGAIVAILMGVLGRKAAAQGMATNKGMATAGVILGIIGTFLMVVVIVVLLTDELAFMT